MRESRVRNHRTVLAGRRKFTIVHCSRFWDHMFKIAQKRKIIGQVPSKNRDRTLFTLLAGRRKFTIVHCPRFWDHMLKTAQHRNKNWSGGLQQFTIENCSRFWPVVENSRSYIVHASGTTCLKSVKTDKKVVWRSSSNHDRKLFTLPTGGQKLSKGVMFDLMTFSMFCKINKPLELQTC